MLCNWSLQSSDIVDETQVHRACLEREILSFLDHPFLPTLYASFQVSHYLFIHPVFCTSISNSLSLKLQEYNHYQHHHFTSPMVSWGKHLLCFIPIQYKLLATLNCHYHTFLVLSFFLTTNREIVMSIFIWCSD